MAVIGCRLVIELAASGADAPPIFEPLPELRVWDETITLKTGFGYKDNLLLSDINREGNPFALNGAELSLWRLPVDGTQFYFLADGEDTRYFHGKSLNSEQVVVGSAQLNRQFAAAWQGGLGLDFAHQNQVIDTSITETNLSTALLNGQMVKLHPSLKWTLTGGEWVEGELMVDRQFVRRPFDGYWEGGPKVKSGFSYGSRSEFTASYQGS